MKVSLFLVIGMLFLITHTTYAQTPVVFKYKTDPAYSTHNYKHLNKAAVASKYNLDRLTFFTYVPSVPALELQTLNYKNQGINSRMGVTGAILPMPAMKKSQSKLKSPANYKHHIR